MKIFSIPLNPKLTEQQFYEFLEFCKVYKNYIYDIYFTCRIPPFVQDAMGDVFISSEDFAFIVETALYVQAETGIPISATFNNTQVRPSQQMLDLWIKNFKPIYDAGVRSATIPHTHWIKTGQIKKHFPDLFVKNTILREVREARDVANLAGAGFDYVNLDRVLMRDHQRIAEIVKVKQKYPKLKLSLLANEGCIGGCSVMSEHFQFNNTRLNSPQYFNDPISRVSCPKWDTEDIAVQLKTANFPPWKADWDEILSLGIDVIKMHGRESDSRMYETMDIIKRYATNSEILFDTFNEYIQETNLQEKPINAWRKIIKNCKFDCWNCNFCDKVWKAKGNTNNKKVEKIAELLLDSVNHNTSNTVEGLTSSRVKSLVNLIASQSKSYLEVGVLNGATFCSALENNSITAYAIDHWKDPAQAANGSTNIQSNKHVFIENVKQYKGDNKVLLFDCDFRDVDLNQIEELDFVFYDADHSHETTSAFINMFSSKFADNAVLVFDDANFEGVVSGVNQGISSSGLEVVYDKLILNDQEDPDQWWNGVYILIVKKK